MSTKKTAKGGKRADLDNQYFRSTWEANICRYLLWLVEQGEIKSYAYEPCEFEFPVKRGNRFYKPDFRVVNTDGSHEWWEIKGYMDKDSAVKLKRMAKHYPQETVILIDSDAYRAIAKWRRLIPGWESET